MIEVIVINDGSNDGGKTENVAKSFGNNIKYVQKENGGVASALNEGIRLAKGEYISWLSHDDMYTPDKIEKQIQFLSTYKSKYKKECILYSHFISLDIVENTRIDVTSPKLNPDEFYEALLLAEKFSLHGCTTIIPREAFDKLGFFNEKLKTTQDYDMWLRLNATYDFVLMDDYLIVSRIHPLQGTVTMKEIHKREKNELQISALNCYFHETNKAKFAIKRYGRIIWSLKKRGYSKAYKYSLKMLKEKKIALTGFDVLYIMYAFIYIPKLAEKRLYEPFDTIISHLVK